jgi:hypothetical protein
MADSPKHYQHNLTAPRKETPAMRMGSAIHRAVLEPDRLGSTYVRYEGDRRGKKWTSFAESAAESGANVLTATEYDRVEAIVRAVYSHPHAVDLLGRATVREKRLDWTIDCGLGGHVDVRGTPDSLAPDFSILAGLKTTGIADPRRWDQEATRMNYHAQSSIYVDGIEILYGVRPAVYWIVVEQRAPHDVAVYHVGEDVLAEGRRCYRQWIDDVIHCERADEWPGRSPEIVPFELPAWASPPLILDFGGESEEF